MVAGAPGWRWVGGLLRRLSPRGVNHTPGAVEGALRPASRGEDPRAPAAHVREHSRLDEQPHLQPAPDGLPAPRAPVSHAYPPRHAVLADREVAADGGAERALPSCA